MGPSGVLYEEVRVDNMALPISASEVYQVGKFAYDLWNACKGAKGELDQLGKVGFESCGMGLC